MTIIVDNIVDALAVETGWLRNDILSTRGQAPLARVRQLGYYLARDLTTHSYPQIGRAFGGRDHSTVVYGERNWREYYRDFAEYRAVEDRVRARLQPDSGGDMSGGDKRRREQREQILGVLQSAVKPMTIAEIAEATGLQTPCIGPAVRKLVADDLAHQEGERVVNCADGGWRPRNTYLASVSDAPHDEPEPSQQTKTRRCLSSDCRRTFDAAPGQWFCGSCRHNRDRTGVPTQMEGV